MPNPMAMFQRALEQIGDLARRVRILEVRNPLENAAVDRGGLYIKSNEGLIVQGSAKVEGWLIVTGTQRITGRLEGSGTIDWTGPTFWRGVSTVVGSMEIQGPLTIKGTTVVEGDLAVKKTLDVTATTRLRAKTTLESDLELTSGGSIKAGAIVIDPLGTNNGRITGGSVFDIIAGGMIRLLSNVTISGYIILNGITAQPKAGVAPGGLWIDTTSRRVYFAPAA